MSAKKGIIVGMDEYVRAMEDQPAAVRKATAKRRPSILRDPSMVVDFRVNATKILGAPKVSDTDRHYMTGIAYGLKLGANLGRKRSEATFVALNRALSGDITVKGEKVEDVLRRATSHAKRKPLAKAV